MTVCPNLKNRKRNLNPKHRSKRTKESKIQVVGDREQNLQLEERVFVQSNVWSIHYNKKIWGEDADKFRPER